MKKAGEIYKLPKLAETLKILAKEGADALYNGSLTSRFIGDLKTIGGIMSKEDLGKYEWVCPYYKNVYLDLQRFFVEVLGKTKTVNRLGKNTLKKIC